MHSDVAIIISKGKHLELCVYNPSLVYHVLKKKLIEEKKMSFVLFPFFMIIIEFLMCRFVKIPVQNTLYHF